MSGVPVINMETEGARSTHAQEDTKFVQCVTLRVTQLSISKDLHPVKKSQGWNGRIWEFLSALWWSSRWHSW